ncbi:oxygenase MpaB family protein [Nocardioides pelophilus]|uniref:oxygenase MpaB family protein n=1 Tax=Nocardioides pelophilus TaxID=2172019 RepID=UPI0016004108|nr:oxygenase MpaB family protein [Nocardioides pelophilus]
MTTHQQVARTDAPVGAYPTRFREAEARSVRLGRPLRVMGRVKDVDEALMDRIGRAFGERDELGAALADAIRMRAGQPGRVTFEQLRTALAGGIVAVPDAPEALAAFCAEVEQVPEWVDWDLVDEGALVARRLGQNAADVLTQLALIGGYRFGGPADLLVATGGLVGDSTRRRLGETQKWVVELTRPGSLRPPMAGTPGGEAWRLTVHVRAMHALVNATFEPRWDTERWGLPINQADQASTLFLFDGVLIIGCRGLGVRVGSRDARALMHLWKYVGWLMGVDADFLVDDEWERHRQSYHVLLAQADISEAGPQLARAIVAAQRERSYPGWPRRLQWLRARYEQERLLSMLTTFLGPTSMREFGLPLRPPWAHLYIAVLNTVRYRLLGRTAWGRRRLLAWGDRVSQNLLDSYFLDEEQDVGQLKA